MHLWDFAWVADPSAWAGLGTLVLIEIVLGVDNIVFISILASSLPQSQRRRAFLTGLGLALAARLLLLSGAAFVVTLTTPLFSLAGRGFSWRDIILLAGGLFLLLKGTMEMHGHLEGEVPEPGAEERRSPRLWQVVTQIVVLDAIFSVDSVVTSVGMVQQLSIMYLAVLCAVGFMLLASGPLVSFIERHPTVLVLCLGFLLMIGLGLIADGVGVHIPKGYLYTAILFSLSIEFCNQYALSRRRRRAGMWGMREATARAVLGLLGAQMPGAPASVDALALGAVAEGQAFAPEEREIVGRVIRLSGRTARFIMTPAQRARWLDPDASLAEAKYLAASTGLAWLPVRNAESDEVLGVVPVSGLFGAEEETFSPRDFVRRAPSVLEHTPLADVLSSFRANPVPLLVVVDEYGSAVGQILPANLVSVLAGQMGDMPSGPESCRQPDGSWRLPGRLSVDMAVAWLGLAPPKGSGSATLAGLLLEKLQRIPREGERLTYQGWRMEIARMDGRRIDEVTAFRPGPAKRDGKRKPGAGGDGPRR